MEKRIDQPDGSMCLLPTSLEYKIYSCDWSHSDKTHRRAVAETMKAIARGCTNAHVSITEMTIKPHGYPITFYLSRFESIREGEIIPTDAGPTAVFKFRMQGKEFYGDAAFSLFSDLERDIDNHVNEIALYELFG